MILIDNSQIVLASIFSQYRNPEEIIERDPMNLIRHMTLNTYLYIKQKYNSTYGDLVICQDSNNCWRKDIFPLYKANRKSSQEKNQVYWDEVYAAMHKISEEIADNMPYKNLKIDRCEADDIIAVLAKHYSPSEKVLIVSNDKDFQQLLYYPNVEIYSPLKRTIVTCDDPTSYLFEHIVRGDSGDGIPNIISDADTLVTESKRQKPITAKRLNEFKNSLMTDAANAPHVLAFKRNESLIDLNMIPSEYVDQILNEFKKPIINKGKILNYFMEHKLTNLMSELAYF
jgi:hypothetical protein